MDVSSYFVRGKVYAGGDPALQHALARVYDTSERPRCMCMPGGIEMYVAKLADYVVKRMPGTGQQHHVGCHSYQPDGGTSGLGELMGEAIIEHAPEEIEIRTAFSLARIVGKPMPRGEAVLDPPSVASPRRRMSLRAVLHFLYDRAGFNRWYPAMEGRRSQAVICRYLTGAADGVRLKGATLADRLYVPEQFRVADAAEIGERRRRRLATLLTPDSDGQFKLAILIGQLLTSEPGIHGRRIVVKHMPDVAMYMDTKAWQKAERAYGATLEALDADVECKPRVLMAALIYARREHLYQIDALSLMLVSDQWLPLDGLYELPLVEALQAERRAFIKPLKFDANTSAGFPNALLLDAGPNAVPLHVVSPFMNQKERALKDKTTQALGDQAWVWQTEREMPDFPAPQRHVRPSINNAAQHPPA